jgi:predicted RNA-binding Zn-ribbon protein involved in translation (DUF1610 family)
MVSMFNETRTIPILLINLAPVTIDVTEHFKTRGYEVESTQMTSGGWDISITKGGAFKAFFGLKTALKAQIRPVADGTEVHLSVGIFGREVIPTAITAFVAWPVILPQIWGLVQQHNLNHEVFETVEASARGHFESRFCTSCGAQFGAAAHFCPGCGRPIDPEEAERSKAVPASGASPARG